MFFLAGFVNHYVHSLNFLTKKKSSSVLTHTCTSSTSQEAVEGQTTNAPWVPIAIAFIIVAIVLAIISIALGTMLYRTRKCLNSGSASKLVPLQGL